MQISSICRWAPPVRLPCLVCQIPSFPVDGAEPGAWPWRPSWEFLWVRVTALGQTRDLGRGI